MKKHYSTYFLLITLFGFLVSCGSDDATDYSIIPIGPQSPVTLDINQAPYDSLSQYNFFEGELKNLQPVYGVLPYDLNSSLFTDYALKKRFVYMPAGSKAIYRTDGEVLDFPIGTALIKTFYYDNALPNRTTVLIESRVMIKKQEGWIFANYVWNSTLTNAVLTTTRSRKPISWYQGNTVRTVNYSIPSQAQCALCHTLNDVPTAIGVKPQNLNKNYTYPDGSSMNQLAKWIDFGYLNNAPTTVNSSVDWADVTHPLALRARSYLDINCAHCHTRGAYCGNTPMDLAFSKTHIDTNLGICVQPQDFVTGDQRYLIAKQDAEGSLLAFRIKSADPAEMMPLLGRTLIHREGVFLIEDWINAMSGSCP